MNAHAFPLSVERAAGFRRVRKLARRARGPLIKLALIASLAGLAWASWRFAAITRENAVIADLNGGRDVAVEFDTASDSVLLARANYLLFRDRISEAQTIADVSALRMSPERRLALVYNLANARLRTAITAIENGALDAAISQVNLAKTAYREALRIDPGAWDVKYNLDIAMRLVRDLPQADSAEDQSEETPTQLWTDLPGVPKGLP